MEQFSKVVEIAYRIAIVAVAATALYWYYEDRGNGKNLRVIVVEQKGLIDRLRSDFDLFKRHADDRHNGLLERLRNLEKGRGVGDKE